MPRAGDPAEDRGRQHAGRDAHVQVDRRRLTGSGPVSTVARTSAPPRDRLVAIASTPRRWRHSASCSASLMAASMVRFIALGWVDEFYVLPTFHFTWELVPVGAAPAGGADAPAFRGARRPRAWRRTRVPLPRLHAAVLRRLHLRRVDRQDDLSQSLLSGQPAERIADRRFPPITSGPSMRGAGRARAPDGPGLDGQPPALPDRRGLRLRGPRQDQRRLAARRPAAAHLAGGAQRPADRRTVLHRHVGGVRVQLVRRRLRPHHRLLPAVAANAADRLCDRASSFTP